MLGGVSYLFSQIVAIDSFAAAAPVSHPDHIEDIPDDDAVVADMQNMSLKANEAMPSADDIPDMEEDDLEDAMNSNIVAPVKPACVLLLPIRFRCLTVYLQSTRGRKQQYPEDSQIRRDDYI